MTKTRIDVAEEIRVEIARQRVTQASIAAALGVSPASMSKKLSGQQPLKAVEVERIADILSVSVSYLYGEHPSAA